MKAATPTETSPVSLKHTINIVSNYIYQQHKSFFQSGIEQSSLLAEHIREVTEFLLRVVEGIENLHKYQELRAVLDEQKAFLLHICKGSGEYSAILAELKNVDISLPWLAAFAFLESNTKPVSEELAASLAAVYEKDLIDLGSWPKESVSLQAVLLVTALSLHDQTLLQLLASKKLAHFSGLDMTYISAHFKNAEQLYLDKAMPPSLAFWWYCQIAINAPSDKALPPIAPKKFARMDFQEFFQRYPDYNPEPNSAVFPWLRNICALLLEHPLTGSVFFKACPWLCTQKALVLFKSSYPVFLQDCLNKGDYNMAWLLVSSILEHPSPALLNNQGSKEEELYALTYKETLNALFAIIIEDEQHFYPLLGATDFAKEWGWLEKGLQLDKKHPYLKLRQSEAHPYIKLYADIALFLAQEEMAHRRDNTPSFLLAYQIKLFKTAGELTHLGMKARACINECRQKGMYRRHPEWAEAIFKYAVLFSANEKVLPMFEEIFGRDTRALKQYAGWVIEFLSKHPLVIDYVSPALNTQLITKICQETVAAGEKTDFSAVQNVDLFLGNLSALTYAKFCEFFPKTQTASPSVPEKHPHVTKEKPKLLSQELMDASLTLHQLYVQQALPFTTWVRACLEGAENSQKQALLLQKCLKDMTSTPAWRELLTDWKNETLYRAEEGNKERYIQQDVAKLGQKLSKIVFNFAVLLTENVDSFLYAVIEEIYKELCTEMEESSVATIFPGKSFAIMQEAIFFLKESIAHTGVSKAGDYREISVNHSGNPEDREQSNLRFLIQEESSFTKQHSSRKRRSFEDRDTYFTQKLQKKVEGYVTRLEKRTLGFQLENKEPPQHWESLIAVRPAQTYTGIKWLKTLRSLSAARADALIATEDAEGCYKLLNYFSFKNISGTDSYYVQGTFPVDNVNCKAMKNFLLVNDIKLLVLLKGKDECPAEQEVFPWDFKTDHTTIEDTFYQVNASKVYDWTEKAKALNSYLTVRRESFNVPDILENFMQPIMMLEYEWPADGFPEPGECEYLFQRIAALAQDKFWPVLCDNGIGKSPALIMAYELWQQHKEGRRAEKEALTKEHLQKAARYYLGNMDAVISDKQAEGILHFVQYLELQKAREKEEVRL